MTEKPLVVFFGTSGFAAAILKVIMSAGWPVELVITEPPAPAGRGLKLKPAPVDAWASACGLSIIRPQKLRDPGFIAKLQEVRSQIFIVAAYGRIIPSVILEIPKFGIINVHPSWLPHFRGPSPICTAILSGQKKTGVSIMLLDQGMDTGPVLAQVEAPLNADDTHLTLEARLAQVGADLLIKTIPPYLHGDIKPVPQTSTAELPTKKITRSDGQIAWGKSAHDLLLAWRAYTPWPGLWTLWNGQVLKLLRIDGADLDGPAIPGLVRCQGEKVYIGTGQGYIEILEIQIQGSRPMTVKEFIRGHREFESASLA